MSRFFGFVLLLMFIFQSLCSAEQGDNSQVQNRIKFLLNQNNLREARKLIDEHPEIVLEKNSKGNILLEDIAFLGDLELFRHVYPDGYDVNTQSWDGSTLLHHACFGGKKDIAGFLISKGADVKLKKRYDITPLHYAAFTNPDLVKLLISNGADVNAQDSVGRTPVIESLTFPNREDTTLILLSSGADVRIKDDEGKTPLHYAFYSFTKGVVKEIIDAGADVNAVDKDGKTPLYYAVKTRKPNDIQTLLQNGAKPETDILIDCFKIGDPFIVMSFIVNSPLHLLLAVGLMMIITGLIGYILLGSRKRTGQEDN